MLPKLSIITVTYNVEKLVSSTIESVLQQKYPNLEYIIIDGKSTDKTIEVVKKYSSQIDVIVSEKDKNLYHAMNKGLKLATGDYVNFLNAGDTIHENFDLAKFMKNGNGKDFLYANVLKIDSEGKFSPWHKSIPQPNNLSDKSFLSGSVICHQCMFPKRVLAPTFEEDRWKISADLEWSIKLMRNTQTFHYEDSVYCVFLDGGISSKLRQKSWIERWHILKEQFGLIQTIRVHVGYLLAS